MIYTEELINSVSAEPITGTVRICELAENALDGMGNEWTEREYEVLIEASALIESLIEANIIECPIHPPELFGDIIQDCRQILNFLMEVKRLFSAEQSLAKHQSAKARFTATLGARFHYEFSQGDLDEVQRLINELRDMVSASTHLEDEHRHRVLKRLERLQSELHKKVSDLDRFWGLIGDAGVVFGKLGKDAKPFVDRITEISRIVWQTQARAEELPSGTPIPKLEDKNAEE
ncbi:hypothetical protein [Polycyclovorans algicola]|uniref:hypothetical protein n=1 Tax=Polycyclovorans algicola TaxID=616992 RepID=UPI0004A6B4ED|nr:hypothetical protein [Polycyclovorans algicola]